MKYFVLIMKLIINAFVILTSNIYKYEDEDKLFIN